MPPTNHNVDEDILVVSNIYICVVYLCLHIKVLIYAFNRNILRQSIFSYDRDHTSHEKYT